MNNKTLRFGCIIQKGFHGCSVGVDLMLPVMHRWQASLCKCLIWRMMRLFLVWSVPEAMVGAYISDGSA
jgi:hypothetical protein